MICAIASILLLPLQAATPVPTPTPVEGSRVAIETSMGRIVAVLYPEAAPIAVENFLTYVKERHYDGTIFHRVIPDFMIQGGGYDVVLAEKPAHDPIRNEARNGLRNSRGTLAMARGDKPNTARAQFFINLRNNDMLDFGIAGAGYTVFGRVVEGMDVVDRIAAVHTSARGPHESVPDTPVVIKTVRVIE